MVMRCTDDDKCEVSAYNGDVLMMMGVSTPNFLQL